MTIAFEIIIIAIFAVCAFIGIKFGFIKLAAKPVKFVLALILAFTLSSVVAEKVVTPIIDEPVTNYVSDFLYSNCSDLTGDNLNEKLPTLLKLAATVTNVDLESGMDMSGADLVAAIVDKLIGPVISFVSSLIAFFAVYFVSKILLWLVFWLINSCFGNGLLGVVNRVLGFLFFGFIGIVAAWGFAVITELVIHVPAFAENPTFASFEGGLLYNFFNTYNPMELLLSF